MKEGCPCNIGNRRANLLSSMYDVNSECVHSIPSNIISVDSRYQHLPLVVVYKKTPNHFWKPEIKQTNASFLLST